MDTLTHALSGALFARATAPSRPHPDDPPLWQRVSLCTVAAAFPDSDVIVGLFSSYAYLLHHRGATHSLILFPLWALLLGSLAALVFRRARSWSIYAGVAALGIVAHILGDLITTYGTLILAPFSNQRFAWGTTFIIDLWFSGIIVAGLLASLFWRRTRIPALAASLALFAYVGMQALWRAQAIEVGEQYARNMGITGARVSAQPGAVTPLNWMVMVEKNGDYRYAYVNLKRKEIARDPGPEGGFFESLSAPYHPPSLAIWRKSSLLGSYPSDAALAREAWMSSELEFFRWFAQYPALLRVERGNPSECVWFQDLRFVRPGVSFNPFRFGLCREIGGPWERYRMSGASGRAPFH